MEKTNERDETVELAKAVVKRNARKELETMLTNMAIESKMSREEIIHSDMEVMAIACMVNLIEKEEFPDAFWVEIYFKAGMNGYLKEVIDRFDVKVIISLKRKYIPSSNPMENMRAYA